MRKKGAIILITLVIVLVGLFVVFVIPSVAKEYASGKIALKNAAARDIALILDTLYAYSLDIELKYNYDLSGFSVEIEDSKVKISSINKRFSDPAPGEYYFEGSDKELQFEKENPQLLTFNKIDGEINIR
jgi:uncharacterized protein YpmS